MPRVGLFHLFDAPTPVASRWAPRPRCSRPPLMPLKGWYAPKELGIAWRGRLLLLSLEGRRARSQGLLRHQGAEHFEALGRTRPRLNPRFPDWSMLKYYPNASIAVPEDELGRHGSRTKNPGPDAHSYRGKAAPAEVSKRVLRDGHGLDIGSIEASVAVRLDLFGDKLMDLGSRGPGLVKVEVDRGNRRIQHIAHMVVSIPSSTPRSKGMMFLE